MEKTFETGESRKLRLWYAKAVVHPPQKYSRDFVKPGKVVIPSRDIIIPFQMQFLGEEDEWKFIDKVSDDGSFRVRDVADFHFCLATAKETHIDSGENRYRLPEISFKKVDVQRVSLSELVSTDEKRFKKYFRGGEGKIISMNYALTKDCVNWRDGCNPLNGYRDSLTYNPLNTSFHSLCDLERSFTFGDFLHVLGKSPIIEEEQIRRYKIPQVDKK